MVTFLTFDADTCFMNLGKAQRFHDSSRSPKHEIPPETTKHQENTTLENVNMMPPHVLWISVRNRNFMITPDPGNTRPHPRQQKESGTPCIMENHELPVTKKTKKNENGRNLRTKNKKLAMLTALRKNIATINFAATAVLGCY